MSMRAANQFLIESNLPKLLKTLKIAVIFGGDKHQPGAVINKTHNPRSDKTYEYVADDIVFSLKKIGFENVIKIPEDMRLGQALLDNKIDIAWLNSGGMQGASSCAHGPSILEQVGIPYVGHNPLNAVLLDSKHIFKSMLTTMGIDTAKFLVVDPKVEKDDALIQARIESIYGDYDGPFIAKPVSGRASQHVYHVEHKSDLLKYIHEINHVTHGQVMVEMYLSGREYAMACMGPLVQQNGVLVDLHTPFAFSAVERVLDEDEKIFTSMDIKKISNDRVKVLNKVSDAEVWNKMAVACERIVAEMGLTSAIRVDFRADSEGNIHVLEANPKPDLKRPTDSQISLVAAGLYQYGMDYEDLILSLLLNKIHALLTYQPLMAPKLVEMFQDELAVAA